MAMEFTHRTHASKGRRTPETSQPVSTARQANAWTWGLSPDQYNSEVRT